MQTMKAIIKRLKAEKKEIVARYFEAGMKEGLAWAEAASYEELVAAKKLSGCRDCPYPHELFMDKLLGFYFRGRIVGDPLMGADNGDDEFFSDQGAEWVNGWFGGFWEFWCQVKDKLN